MTSPVAGSLISVPSYFCRSMFSAMGIPMMMTAGESPCESEDDDEDWDAMRKGLRDLHVVLEIRSDGTFQAEWTDPRDRALATVSGTWEREGLYTVLVGTEVDGIPQDKPHREPFQMADGRLMGQAPELGGGDENGQGVNGWAGWQQLGWPDMDGSAFARDKRARR
jgi:hypothetical protein